MAPTTDARTVRVASTAVFVVFALAGVNFSSWAARLPAVRDALDLRPDQMGLLLLLGSIGSIVALPLSGLVVIRLGAARAVLSFALLNCTGYVVAATGVALGTVPLTAVGLVMCGVGTGVWDASMNLEGAVVEQRLGRTVMPRYHAGFSVGTVAAAGVAALAARADVPVQVHLPVVVVLSAVAVAVSVRHFLPAGHDEAHAPVQEAAAPAAAAAPAEAAVAAAPSGAAAPAAPAPVRRSVFAAWLEPRTLLIGLVVLAAAVTEGAGNDWLSLAVVDGFDRPDVTGAIAFGVFVAAMTLMRFLGTMLLDRYGRVPVLRLCGALALVGLLVFGLAPSDMLWLAMAGAVLWGMGAALGFPVGMSAASDDPLRAAARVSVVSTIGYSAFLAGPPLLGLLAQHVGYRHALLVIALPIVVGLLVAHVAAPPREPVTARPTLVP